MSMLQTAEWTNSIQLSMLYRLARLFGCNPDMISLAGGVPDPAFTASQGSELGTALFATKVRLVAPSS